MRILIMGLPGSGKTTLALNLFALLSPEALWLNADEIRTKFNDWDFTEEGRLRQSRRMREIADVSNKDYIIADFICPLPAMRDIYAADYTVWVDTIHSSIYENTNQMFEAPEYYNLHVTTQDAAKWSKIILEKINER
jgi:adenylylsulfate kinase